MAMSNQERARKAARARWSGSTAAERGAALEAVRGARTSESRLRAVRTQAERLGYRLVPLDASPRDGA